VTDSPELADARRLLLACYRQWQTLSEAEAGAIDAGRWPDVERAQSAKQDLQQSIVSATETLRAAAQAAGVPAARLENDFHDLVDHLIQLETRNHDQIVLKRKLAQEAWAQLQVASQNLRQIQRAYDVPRPACWQSYS